jgi:hypothetical protein
LVPIPDSGFGGELCELVEHCLVSLRGVGRCGMLTI